MRVLIVVTSITAMALVPVTLYAAFRPAPAMDRIVYLPMPAPSVAESCNAKLWSVEDL